MINQHSFLNHRLKSKVEIVFLFPETSPKSLNGGQNVCSASLNSVGISEDEAANSTSNSDINTER